MPPVKVSDFPKEQALERDDIKVGTVLAYKGDRVPYPAGSSLNRHAKNGVYTLPGYSTQNDALNDPSKRAWENIPGSPLDKYEIVKIETNRKAKGGKRS